MRGCTALLYSIAYSVGSVWSCRQTNHDVIDTFCIGLTIFVMLVSHFNFKIQLPVTLQANVMLFPLPVR